MHELKYTHLSGGQSGESLSPSNVQSQAKGIASRFHALDTTVLSRKDRILFLVLATLFGLLVRGYAFGISNQAFYLPYIFKGMDPDLFPGDFMFSFEYNNTFYYPVMAAISRFVHVEWLFAAGYIIFSFVYSWAVFSLSRRIFRSDLVAMFSVLLLLLPKMSFGGEDFTFFNGFYYNVVSIPILLFAIRFFLDKKLFAAFALTAFTFLFHAIPAAHIFGLFIMYFFFDLAVYCRFNFHRFFEKWHLPSIIGSVVLFAAIIAPLLWYKAGSDSTSIFSLQQDQEWLRVLELRIPHHLFPSTWPMQFAVTLPYLFFGLLGILWLNRAVGDRVDKAAVRVVLGMLTGFLVYMVIGTLFTEWLPIELVIMFLLFRSTLFLITLAVFFIAYLLSRLLQSGKTWHTVLAVGLAAGVFTANAPFLYVFSILAIPLLWTDPPAFLLKGSHWLFILCIAGVGILSLHSLLGAPLEALPAFDPVPSVFFVGFGLIVWFWGQKSQRLVGKAVRVAILSTAFALLGIYHVVEEGFWDYQPKDWIELQKWARENTDQESSFIVPPWEEGFRVYSQRAIYGDWKDGTLSLFSHRFCLTWYERMRKLGYFNSEDERDATAYRDLSREKIIEIAEESGQDYIIFERGKDIELPLVYDNASYQVHLIPRADSR